MTAQKQRRSIKNVVMTKAHHMLYMGPQIFITLMILGLIYATLIHRIFAMAQEGQDIPYATLAVISTVCVTVAAILSVGSAIVAAHRIAGVHIKLAQVFDRIAAGEFDTRLKFRSTDKLEEVEVAFNNMMDSLRSQMGLAADKAECDEGPEEKSS